MSVKAPAQAGRLWVRLVHGQRTLRDITVPCVPDAPLPALREAMHTLDLETPVWLPSHQTDWAEFRLARFTQVHFLETIPFDRMDISYIAPETETKKGPVNARNA